MQIFITILIVALAALVTYFYVEIQCSIQEVKKRTTDDTKNILRNIDIQYSMIRDINIKFDTIAEHIKGLEIVLAKYSSNDDKLNTIMKDNSNNLDSLKYIAGTINVVKEHTQTIDEGIVKVQDMLNEAKNSSKRSNRYNRDSNGKFSGKQPETAK